MLLRLLLKDKPFPNSKLYWAQPLVKLVNGRMYCEVKGCCERCTRFEMNTNERLMGPYCSPVHSQWILNLYETLNWRRMSGRNSDQFRIYSRSWCFHNTIAQHNIVCCSVALEDFKNKFMYVYLCWALHTT